MTKTNSYDFNGKYQFYYFICLILFFFIFFLIEAIINKIRIHIKRMHINKINKFLNIIWFILVL